MQGCLRAKMTKQKSTVPWPLRLYRVRVYPARTPNRTQAKTDHALVGTSCVNNLPTTYANTTVNLGCC